jgi:hypothetical protein
VCSPIPLLSHSHTTTWEKEQLVTAIGSESLVDEVDEVVGLQQEECYVGKITPSDVWNRLGVQVRLGLVFKLAVN